jgi:penicillin-binding protein activator
MKIYLLLLFSMLFLVAGCSTSRQVQRVDAKTQIDLSGRWNDTDSKLVAEEMIKDVLSRPWLQDFVADKGDRPTVIVGLVKNKTHELISTDTFIKDIEREFINSGRVRVVQAGEAREELRDEREDQQQYASSETIKQWGRERGADFMMQGVVNSIVDQEGNQKVVFYQTDLELTNLETNEKVWIGNKKIKKVVTN